MNRKIRGTILILAGLALAFGGASVYAKYDRQATLAEQNSKVLLQELSHEINDRHLSGVVVEAPEGQMPQVMLQGQSLVGILKADEADVQLPVLESWSYEKLEYGPCRYSGSLEEENLILLGHNYKGHLEKLDRLEAGDEVEFTDVAGKNHLFRVAQTEVLRATQVEELESSPYPLTIFTCTPNGQSRFVVYCEKK